MTIIQQIQYKNSVSDSYAKLNKWNPHSATAMMKGPVRTPSLTTGFISVVLAAVLPDAAVMTHIATCEIYIFMQKTM